MKIEFKNFNKNYPLYLACGLDDKIRTSLHYIMFKDGYAYATNSYILVRAKLEDISNFDEEDINKLDGFYIHAQSFKAIQKSKGGVVIEEGQIRVRGEEYDVVYPLKDKLSCVRFPDCESVLNKDAVAEVTLQVEFGLNDRYLAILGDVMNAYNGVHMRWKSNNMFEVTPIGQNAKDIKGIIMTKMI